MTKKNSSKSISSNKNSTHTNSINGAQMRNNNNNNNNNLNMGVSFENKSEDGNISIPHIADFYPEGTYLFLFK